MHNVQTYSIADLHHVITVVGFAHGKAIQITPNVIGGTRINVPIWVYLAGTSG
jgi:hypothetical protein